MKFLITVADTVGAGDSFLATFISKLLNNSTTQESINYTCVLGAIVASKRGANPKITNKEISEMLQL